MNRLIIFIYCFFIAGCVNPKYQNISQDIFKKIDQVNYEKPDYNIFDSSKKSNSSREENITSRNPSSPKKSNIVNFNTDHFITPSDTQFMFVIDANIGLSEAADLEFIKADLKYKNKAFNCHSTGIRLFCQFGLKTDLGIYPEYGRIDHLQIFYSSNIFDEVKAHQITIDHNNRFNFSITIRDNVATYNKPDLRSNLNFRLPKNKVLVVASKQSDNPFVRVYVDGSFYWIFSSMIRKYVP